MQSNMDEVGLNESIVIILIPVRIYNVKVVSVEGSNSLSLLVSYRPPTVLLLIDLPSYFVCSF